PGVSLLLLFIGVKLLIHEFVDIDAMLSLAVILVILVGSIVGSLLIKENKGK
ncbi:MAG: TerC family protein, partial [Prevotella sp.]|nr:TerC family protein [Prevotella sp.]MDY3876309.1 TerC family protein [Prevotella sp.]